jgi:hypothetical protein
MLREAVAGKSLGVILNLKSRRNELKSRRKYYSF